MSLHVVRPPIGRENEFRCAIRLVSETYSSGRAAAIVLAEATCSAVGGSYRGTGISTASLVRAVRTNGERLGKSCLKVGTNRVRFDRLRADAPVGGRQ